MISTSLFLKIVRLASLYMLICRLTEYCISFVEPANECPCLPSRSSWRTGAAGMTTVPQKCNGWCCRSSQVSCLFALPFFKYACPNTSSDCPDAVIWCLHRFEAIHHHWAKLGLYSQSLWETKHGTGDHIQCRSHDCKSETLFLSELEPWICRTQVEADQRCFAFTSPDVADLVRLKIFRGCKGSGYALIAAVMDPFGPMAAARLECFCLAHSVWAEA